MKFTIKHFENFGFWSVFFALNCIFAIEANAQTFGASGSQETFPNTFSTQGQQTGNKSQAQKSVQFKPVGENIPSYDPNQEKPVIQIFMDNFQILPTFSKMTHCSMTFHVRSTLESPISNISFRLKWPDMETPVSFDNIPSKGTTSKSYLLLGNGCYQMDETPTVIINRCRVKGLTQEACTGLIEWVK